MIEEIKERDREKEKLVNDMADAMANAELPDLKAIVSAFFRKVGGADGIAKMLLREYNEAKSGTAVRAMILQMILQGSKTIHAKEQARDLTMISDEDLEKELGKIVGTGKAKSRSSEGVSR